MERLVVLFPDLQGKGSFGDFGRNLKRLNLPEDTVFIPILNGDTRKNLILMQNQARDNGFMPVVSLEKGLLPTLVAGYRTIISRYPLSIVVRIDTAEHDLSFIERLAEEASESNGMVIGDLEFSPKTLIEGTPDWFIHLKVFPLMYGQFSEGKLPLSCAHGFNAFAPGVISGIFDRTIEIIRAAEQEFSSSLPWGFDAAIALAAYQSGVPIKIVYVPAQSVRNRDPEKIAAQFSETLMICRASLIVSGKR